MTDKHSPTPWKLQKAECGYIYALANSANDFIRIETQNEANAALIVEAVNGHAAHKEAVRELVEALDWAIGAMKAADDLLDNHNYIKRGSTRGRLTEAIEKGWPLIAKHSPEKVRG
jgi:hypothetical protein